MAGLAKLSEPGWPLSLSPSRLNAINDLNDLIDLNHLIGGDI